MVPCLFSPFSPPGLILPGLVLCPVGSLVRFAAKHAASCLCVTTVCHVHMLRLSGVLSPCTSGSSHAGHME